MLVSKKFLVTSDLSVVEAVRREGYNIVLVDGSIDGFDQKYGDFIFDHHRKGGSPVQISDILDNQDMNGYRVFRNMLSHQSPERFCFVTPMLDADAICATAFILMTDSHQEDEKDFLISVSYDCDHLFVPSEYSRFKSYPANVVAGFKKYSDEVILEMGYSLDRRSWSKEDKEKIMSEIYSRSVHLVLNGCFPEDKDYSSKLNEISEKIDNSRISVKKDCVVFDSRDLDIGYIDPRVWYGKCRSLNLDPSVVKSLTVRDLIIGGQYIGTSYTLGVVPLHPKSESVDYTADTYEKLNELEKVVNPDATSWGGRATVGGCPRNGSKLTIDQIVSCM